MAPHGVTGPELNRLSGAVRLMELYCQPKRGLWFLNTDRDTGRSTISAIQKRITKLQIEQGVRPYNVTTFETRGGLHAHIVFLGIREIVERLKSSAAFGEFIQVNPVTNPAGITHKYLAKERTPQAGYGREWMLGGRLRGSHRLDGGGDRVRQSRDLERDAISSGYVINWRHTNARRSIDRKASRLRRLYPRKAPRPAGQLTLLPELDRLVARLHQFGGGFVAGAVALEIEFRRQQLGLSQHQLASRIGRWYGGPEPSQSHPHSWGFAFLGLQTRLACAGGMPSSRTLRRQASSTLATAAVIEAMRMARPRRAAYFIGSIRKSKRRLPRVTFHLRANRLGVPI